MKIKQVVATTLAYFYSKEEIVLILPILNYYHKRIMESFLIEQIRLLAFVLWLEKNQSNLCPNDCYPSSSIAFE